MLRAIEERMASVEAKMDAIADLRAMMTESRRENRAQFDRLQDTVDWHFVWIMGVLMTFFIALLSAIVAIGFRA